MHILNALHIYLSEHLSLGIKSGMNLGTYSYIGLFAYMVSELWYYTTSGNTENSLISDDLMSRWSGFC